MKQRFIFIGVFLVVMAMLPFTVVKCSFSDLKTNSALASSDTVPLNDKNKIICGLVAALYDDSYCTETIRAITILLSTDYDVDSDSFDLENKEVYVSENYLNGSEKDFYTEIEKIVNSNLEFSILKNGEKLYIPYSKTSNGLTVKGEYEYLCSVASPWDCFEGNFDENTECAGVSLSGIDYLCKNGMNAIQALKWYLPDFEITDVHNN